MFASQKARLEALWNSPEVQAVVQANQDPRKHRFVEDPEGSDCFSCGENQEAHQ